MNKIKTTATGEKYRKSWTPGPKPKGYRKILVRIPEVYVLLMEIENEKCGGMLSVNEQIRRAVRARLLGGWVYTHLGKS